MTDKLEDNEITTNPVVDNDSENMTAKPKTLDDIVEKVVMAVQDEGMKPLNERKPLFDIFDYYTRQACQAWEQVKTADLKAENDALKSMEWIIRDYLSANPNDNSKIAKALRDASFQYSQRGGDELNIVMDLRTENERLKKAGRIYLDDLERAQSRIAELTECNNKLKKALGEWISDLTSISQRLSNPDMGGVNNDTAKRMVKSLQKSITALSQKGATNE